MAVVEKKHGAMLDAKRAELLEIVRQCMEEIHTAAGNNETARMISNKADTFFAQKKEQIADTKVLALLDGLVPPMWQYKDETCERMEALQRPAVVPPSSVDEQTQKKVIKTIHRQAMFPAKTLESEAEIDAYVEKIREQMKRLLNGCDGIRLS